MWRQRQLPFIVNHFPSPKRQRTHMNDLARPYTLLTTDIVGSSTGNRRRQAHLDHTHEIVLDRALAAAGMPVAELFRRPDGDSVTLAIPASVPKARVAADLVHREMTIALAEVNSTANAEHRLRLRAALAAGEIVVDPPQLSGEAVTRAARLRDAPALRKVMADHPEVDLGFIVADGLFDEVIRQGERGLDPRQFTAVPVEVKDFAERGWIHLPLSHRSGEPWPAPPATPPGPSAEVINQITGSVDARKAVFGVVKQSARD